MFSVYECSTVLKLAYTFVFVDPNYFPLRISLQTRHIFQLKIPNGVTTINQCFQEFCYLGYNPVKVKASRVFFFEEYITILRVKE